jgi:hypothetical protein
VVRGERWAVACESMLGLHWEEKLEEPERWLVSLAHLMCYGCWGMGQLESGRTRRAVRAGAGRHCT